MNQKHSVILHIIHSVAGKKNSASPLSFSTCLPSWTSNSIQRLAQPVTTMSGEMLLNCGWSCRHISGLVSGVSGGISGNLTHSDRPTQLPCESNPPRGFLKIFPKWLEIFNHTYYTILSTLHYKFLIKYLQHWESYDILSATTQRIFYISLELSLLSLLTEQMTSI